MWWGHRCDHEIDGGRGGEARQGVWCGGQMEGEQGSGQGFPHVYNVLKYFMLETTWWRTLKVTLKKVPSNADFVQKFSHAGRVWRLTWSVYTEERLSACEQCAKAFSSGNNLKIHMKAQAWRRPKQCIHWRCCDKHFTKTKALKCKGGEKLICINVSSETSTRALWLCF